MLSLHYTGLAVVSGHFIARLVECFFSQCRLGKAVVFLLILFLLDIPSAASQNIQWEKIGGTYGGFVNTVIGATDSIVFAGTRGFGVYISTDAGASWTIGGKSIMSNDAIVDLAISRTGDIYTVSSNRYALFKSSDRGTTWITVSESQWQYSTYSVAIDSLDNIYIGTSGGVFISTDGGQEWTRPDDLADIRVEIIRVSQTGVVLVGAYNGLYRSENNGLDWEWIPSIPATWVWDIAFKGTTDAFVASSVGLYRSSDSGINWTPVTGLATIFTVVITPSGTILAGTPIGIARSTNNGATWTFNMAGLENFQIEALTVLGGGSILAATGGYGIYISNDDGQSWLPSSEGLEATNVISLVATPTGKYFAGTSESIFLSTDYGQTWNRQGSALNNGNFRSIRTNSKGVLFACATNGGVLRSRDDGQTWEWVNSGLPWNPSSGGKLYNVTALEINSQDYLLIGVSVSSTVGSQLSGFYRSTDDADSWSQSRSAGGQIMAIAPDVNGCVVFGTPVGSFRSTDGGGTWTFFQNMLGLYIFAISSNRNGDVFAAAYSTGLANFDIFRSTDVGASWEPLIKSQFYSSQISAMTITPEGTIVAGNHGGILISTNNGKTWNSVNQGLPVNSGYTFWVQSLYKDSRGYLYAGSNRGIYRTLGPITSAYSPEESLPKTFVLDQNFPNPFNPTTTITFQLPATSVVSVKVYNALGQEIATLTNGRFEAGIHKTMWDATGFPSGVYFYRLHSGAFTETKTMLLLK